MRPRYRKKNWTALALQQIINTESSAGFEYARNFPVESGFVGNIHCNMLGVGNIEAVVGEWHRQRASLLVSHAIGEPDPRRELRGHPAIFFSQINAGDLALVDRRKLAGRAAEPTADIKDTVLFLQSEMGAQFSSCLAASHVKFVDRCKVF